MCKVTKFFLICKTYSEKSFRSSSLRPVGSRLLVVLLVGVDDSGDELVADDVAAVEVDHADALDAITAAVASHDHVDATQETHGFMSTADKAKLDNLGTFDDFVAAYNANMTGSYASLQTA